MDPEKTRLYEIEFLELCIRLYSINNSQKDIQLFLSLVASFIDFNPRIMFELSRVIFEKRYEPSKAETMILLREQGYNNTEIARIFCITSATVSATIKKEEILFPRSSVEQQTEVTKFMIQYNKIFAPDARNLL